MAEKALQALLLPGLNNVYVNTPLSTAPTFNETQNYEVGDCVFYNIKLYKFISAHTAGAWDNSQVVEITIGSEIKQIENDLNDKYEKPSGGIPASDLASGVVPDVSGKADKVQNATNGNFASLDANGNLEDSGHKHSDYLTEAPVTDVQVDGTSILQDGVANVPVASSSTLGVVIVNGNYGVSIGSANHDLRLSAATSNAIKGGSASMVPITPSNQHISAFYGLAKAAGDTTQSSSSNAVGVYTDSAKDAIKTMLGIDLASGNIQNVSGTTVTITGEPNARYICGEVATIDITPPATGTIIVRFISGSTATVLTLPSTVKMPEWFDSSTLEADTIYELSITDGVYGAVMLWAV